MGFNSICHSLSDALDGGNKIYSVRAAAVFCTVLSLTLWWIPILGPAVAGYVCGRKTGSMTQALVCSVMVGASIMILMWCLAQIVLTLGGFPTVPADEAASSLNGAAAVFGKYLQYFFSPGTSSMDLSAVGILVLFGGVGGILSGQVRREVSDILSKGAVEGAVRPAARTMELYKRDKELGFECFNDYIAVQGTMTSSKQDQRNPEETPPVKQKRPTTTIQTVTSTITGHNPKKADKSGGPFSDILQRSERRKSEKK